MTTDTGDLAEVPAQYRLDHDPGGDEHYGGDPDVDLSDAPEGEPLDLAEEPEED